VHLKDLGVGLLFKIWQTVYIVATTFLEDYALCCAVDDSYCFS